MLILYSVVDVLLSVLFYVLELRKLCLQLLQLRVHADDLIVPFCNDLRLFVKLFVDCSSKLILALLFLVVCAVVLRYLRAPVPVKVYP